MKKKLRRFGSSQMVILFLLFLLQNTSKAFDEMNNITLVTMEQVPYGFKGTDGESTGVLYEILNNIMTASYVEQPNKLLSMKRLLATLSTQRKTCTIIADTPNVIDKYDFIEPLGISVKAGVLPIKGLVLTEFSNIGGITIAVPLGVSFNEELDKNKQISTVYPRNYVNALKMLKNGQVDAVAGPISTLKFVGIKEGMTASDFAPPLIFNKFEMMLVCNDGLSKGVRKRLKNAVIKLKSNGTIQGILDSYYGKNKIKR